LKFRSGISTARCWSRERREKSAFAARTLPKEFIVVDELPKNNAGKLLKREIKEKYGK
jgi:acyl-CoA synthetase (AMP-forming)/AMP-acid ligase II